MPRLALDLVEEYRNDDTNGTVSPVRLTGACYVLCAFDIGLHIDLDEAASRLERYSKRGELLRQRRAPRSVRYDPPPLIVELDEPTIDFDVGRTSTRVECRLYDFGAISLRFRVPFSATLEGLVAFSSELYDSTEIADASREIARATVGRLGSAIERPEVSDLMEDYWIFEIDSIEGASLADLTGAQSSQIARILRAERDLLSEQEVGDALAHATSYSASDLVLVDWMAAFVVDADRDDIRTVLEHANVQLLEMQLLDHQLDSSIDHSFAGGNPSGLRQWFRQLVVRTEATRMARLATLQIECSRHFEGVRHALKLIGDDYLARVYRTCAQRFHLPAWIDSIERKLRVLEGNYERMTTLQSTIRLEVLEWIIILLIGLSMLLPFVAY